MKIATNIHVYFVTQIMHLSWHWNDGTRLNKIPDVGENFSNKMGYDGDIIYNIVKHQHSETLLENNPGQWKILM